MFVVFSFFYYNSEIVLLFGSLDCLGGLYASGFLATWLSISINVLLLYFIVTVIV